ncbi:LLM class flavin-dependent oxidoreductase, partial [Thermoproteota archaeon]
MIPGFGLSSNNELHEDVIRTIVLADELGFDNVWVADHSQYDVFSMLTYLSGITRNIKLGTAVTSPYTRYPVITAAAMATVNEVSNGRGVLGLGAGGEMAVGSQLFDMKRKLLHCREAMEIIKQVFTGETVRYDGKVFKVKNYRLRMKDPKVPLYFAASGPKMLELAGELADGVIINGLGSWPPALKAFLGHVEDGAKQGGRSLGDLDVVCWTRIAISEHPEEIVEKIRPVIALRIAYANERNLKEKYGINPKRAKE